MAPLFLQEKPVSYLVDCNGLDYLLRLLLPMFYMISRREASKVEAEKTKGLKENKRLPSPCLLPFKTMIV